MTQRCDPDMRLVTNIVRRGAVYYFRRRVPDDLQKAIGKTLIRESLNTREPVKARTLGAERSAFWERKFEAARLKLAQRHAGKFTRADLTHLIHDGLDLRLASVAQNADRA